MLQSPDSITAQGIRPADVLQGDRLCPPVPGLSKKAQRRYEVIQRFTTVSPLRVFSAHIHQIDGYPAAVTNLAIQSHGLAEVFQSLFRFSESRVNDGEVVQDGGLSVAIAESSGDCQRVQFESQRRLQVAHFGVKCP